MRGGRSQLTDTPQTARAFEPAWEGKTRNESASPLGAGTLVRTAQVKGHIREASLLGRIFSTITESAYDEISGWISREQSVLDVGCGAQPRLPHVGSGRRSIGVDVYLPSLKRARDTGTRTDFVLADARALPFKPRSVDCVMALDVLEHLSGLEERGFLAEIAFIARKRVVVLTPNGLFEQEEYGGNLHQRHLSGWTVGNLQQRGFSVVGANGLRVLGRRVARLEGIQLSHNFWGFRMCKRTVAFLLRRLPSLGHHLLATRLKGSG